MTGGRCTSNGTRWSVLKCCPWAGGAVFAVVLVATHLGGCGGPDARLAGPSLTDHADLTLVSGLISHVTSSLVGRDGPIAVRFADEHGDREEEPSQLASAFRFSPPVTGAAEWLDGRTLAYHPKQPLVIGAQYQCAFNVAAVLPAAQGLAPLTFQVTAAPNGIEEFTGAFEPADGEDEDVQNHVSLWKDRRLQLEWEAEPWDNKFTFRSEVLRRSYEPQHLDLKIEAEPLGLEADFIRGVDLLPLSELGILGIDVHDQEDAPYVSVHFTETLLGTRDYAGYVSLNPHLDAKVVASGRELLVFADFKRHEPYTLAIRHGVASRYDAVLGEDYTTELQLGDLWPRVAFSQSGAFLPSAEDHTIGFRTLNVRTVRVEVLEVFESNLGHFLQDYGLESSKTRGRLYGRLDRVGVIVASEELEIGTARNEWVQSTLGLSSLLKGHERGLFLVTLTFDKDGILFECDETARYRWDHPCNRGYYYTFGVVSKPVIVTDVGLLAKRESDRMIVAATHLGTTEPLSGVRVTLFSYQNQPLQTRVTDKRGVAVLDSTDGFYLEGRWKGQRTALKFDESALELSGFDVGGTEGTAAATRAFVYTDRGVYRPGDAIHLAAIVRDQKGVFPSDQPIRMKVRDPKNQIVHDEINKKGEKGHYGFEFSTAASDPTGNWYAELYSGKVLLARHLIRIETVVPQRLKVKFELPSDRLGPANKSLVVGLQANYLFGAPASGLRADVHASYSAAEKKFEGYQDFTFTVPGQVWQLDDQPLYQGELGAGGTATFSWDIVDLSRAPSVVYAVLTARVQERGGRPVTELHPVLIDVYDTYVGAKGPSDRYVRVSDPLSFAVIALDREGTVRPGRDLRVSVYGSSRYWWWQYDSREDFRLKFKTDAYTEKLTTFMVQSEDRPSVVEVTPVKQGQLLVEVEDVDGGHTCGFCATATSWAEGQPLIAGTQLEMQSERETYGVGDRAAVAIRTPTEGVAFVSVEKGGRVLRHNWIRLEGAATTFEFDVTEDMLPNAYVNAMVIQPHAQTTNDRPLRLFGVLPIRVEEETTNLPVELRAPGSLKPREEFDVEVAVPEGREATVTVAVVDEGLLELTDFETPDPWAFFFAKERLSVTTYDTYDDVIGALWGAIHKSFEIGGGEELFRKKRLGAERARRFETVAMFHGPVRTGPGGRVKLSFTMPQYIGSVRVMAVAASGNSYGHAEQTVPVTEPLLVLPTLPRVAGPAESFVLPVTVFALEPDLGDVLVSVEASGLLGVTGDTEQMLVFTTKGEQDVSFELSTGDAIGLGEVRVAAASERASTWAETEMDVRSANPYMYGGQEVAFPPHETVRFEIPVMGIEGTEHATLTVSPMPGLRFAHHLARLLRFPYGCVEQVTSAVFPQLYLRDFMTLLRKPSSARHEVRSNVDRNINAAVERLRRFQTLDGGFAYWPGSSEHNQWASNYVGHFLLEAKALGYFVPSDILGGWLTYEKKMASAGAGGLKTRCYRLYLLALAGEPQIGPMNLLREESQDVMGAASRWYLAAAYKLAGMESTASEIASTAGVEVSQYREFGGTYGSTLRDTGILLELTLVTGRDDLAHQLFGEINVALGSREYLSTQELGYCLLAVGKYMKTFWKRDAAVAGRIEANGVQVGDAFEAVGEPVTFDMTPHMGQTVSVTSASDDMLYAVLEWEGIPLEGPTEPVSENMDLEVNWLGDDGLPLDPSELSQGTPFWCHIRVTGSPHVGIENAALTQVFPSGWEIENTRLTGEVAPPWARQFGMRGWDYMDVRDDRVMWFFNLRRREDRDFLVRLNAVTRGSFTLPPTVVEAMYDHDYRALIPGGVVSVVE
jgi:uncharacterized protein YfaS (alpha-2-macroglobulin family)